MGRIVNDTFGPINIAAGASIYQYTVLADGALRIQPFLDAVAGGATDYIAWVQKQRGGAGVSYPFLPLTTGTGIAGWTELAFLTISIDCVAGDVIDVYIDGQPADVAVSGKIEIFRDHTLTEIALAVWDTLTASLTTANSIGKLIVDNLNAAVGSICSCVITGLLALPNIRGCRTQDLTIIRGDTWVQPITRLGDISDDDEIWFTAKRNKDATDLLADIKISSVDGLEAINRTTALVPANGTITVDDAVKGNITVTLEAVESAKLNWEAGIFYFDVQVKDDATGLVRTLRRGQLKLIADVTMET